MRHLLLIRTEDTSKTEANRLELNKKAAEAKLKSKMTCFSNTLRPFVGESWYPILEPEFKRTYFQQMWQHIKNTSNTIYPPLHQVFNWTNMCPIDQVKVVIVGQDPYPGPNQANGLSFGVPVGVKIPPSLMNIFQELARDIEGFQIPSHGTLTGWAEQGVLLLNACLTVEASHPNSHVRKAWKKFTDAVISWLSTNLTGVVFMLWGKEAQKKEKFIDERKHHILKTSHPSNQAAYLGFSGCGHFRLCNQLLKQEVHTTINWNYLPPFF